MGCDIHAALEVNWGYGKERWEAVAKLPDERNYSFFGALNGVRRPMANPLPFWNRGLPDNMSKGAAKWVNGDHSGTWCTLKELRENADAIRKHIDDEYPGFDNTGGILDQWLAIGEVMDNAHAWYDGESDGTLTRFVFNFDS